MGMFAPDGDAAVMGSLTPPDQMDKDVQKRQVAAPAPDGDVVAMGSLTPAVLTAWRAPNRNPSV